MAELTKKDVKEAVVEALEPFANAVQEDFRKVDGRLDKIEFDMTEVKKDVKWMKDNASQLFAKLDEMNLFLFSGSMIRSSRC